MVPRDDLVERLPDCLDLTDVFLLATVPRLRFVVFRLTVRLLFLEVDERFGCTLLLLPLEAVLLFDTVLFVLSLLDTVPREVVRFFEPE